MECSTRKFTVDTLDNNYCPVCGYKLDFQPWVNNSPSDEICPCCGIQYGYDDAAGGDENMRQFIYEKWREQWKKEGMPWKSEGNNQPKNWNPVQQLRNIVES